MPATLGTSAALDSALRRAFSEASVRLQPETRVSDIVTALTAMGLKVEIQDGLLVLSQGETTMHTALALRNFASRPEHAKLFLLSTADPKTWSIAEKTKYLESHSADEYGKLCSRPVLEAGIRTLDPNMDKASYLNLTRAERIIFLREFGPDAAARILQKTK